MNRPLLASLVCLVLSLTFAHSAAASATPSDGTATISGQVLLDNNKPAVSYLVVARSTTYSTAAPAAEAFTDSKGDYSFAVNTQQAPDFFASAGGISPAPDTQYTITVVGKRGLYLEPDGRTVTVNTASPTTGVDFVLTVGPEVTVHATNALTGAPVSTVVVTYEIPGSNGNAEITAGSTDNLGTLKFQLPSLNAQLSVHSATGEPPLNLSYNSAYDQVSLAHAQNVVWNIQVYPAVMPATILWHGRIVGPDGKAIAGAQVNIMVDGNQTALTTDKNGHFSKTLPFSMQDGSGDIPLSAALFATSGRLNILLNPTPEQVWNGMTLHLAPTPLGSFSGTVISLQGQPEPGTRVYCTGFLTGVDTSFDSGVVFSDPGGHFAVNDLPPGAYQLYIGSGSPYSTTILPPSTPDDPDLHGNIPLAAGEHDDLGKVIVPLANQMIGGQVVDQTGKPVSDLYGGVVGQHTNQQVNLNADGTFHVFDLVNEPLTLKLSGNFQTAQNSSTTKVVTAVPVTAGDQAIRIVVPSSSLPPPVVYPPPAPAPTPATGPPVVVRNWGGVALDGFNLTTVAEGTATPSRPTKWQVVLITPTGAVWQGDMDKMPGDKLVVDQDRGTLLDSHGKKLWSGVIMAPPAPAAYFALSNPKKPNYLVLEDAGHHQLWAGMVKSVKNAVQEDQGYIFVVGPNRTIVWRQRMANGYASEDIAHGQVNGKTPSTDTRWFTEPIDGTITFKDNSYRVVIKDKQGRTLSSQEMPTIHFTITPKPGPQPTWDYMYMYPADLCPYYVENNNPPYIWSTDSKGPILLVTRD